MTASLAPSRPSVRAAGRRKASPPLPPPTIPPKPSHLPAPARPSPHSHGYSCMTATTDGARSERGACEGHCGEYVLFGGGGGGGGHGLHDSTDAVRESEIKRRSNLSVPPQGPQRDLDHLRERRPVPRRLRLILSKSERVHDYDERTRGTDT